MMSRKSQHVKNKEMKGLFIKGGGKGLNYLDAREKEERKRIGESYLKGSI